MRCGQSKGEQVVLRSRVNKPGKVHAEVEVLLSSQPVGGSLGEIIP